LSIADIAIIVGAVAAFGALVWVHRPKTPAAAPLKTATQLSDFLRADVDASEKAIEAYISKFEADAKAWADRTAAVQAVKAKVASVVVPTANPAVTAPPA